MVENNVINDIIGYTLGESPLQCLLSQFPPNAQVGYHNLCLWLGLPILSLVPDNQHHQSEGREKQGEEELEEIETKMGILSLSEGKVRRGEKNYTENIMICPSLTINAEI